MSVMTFWDFFWLMLWAFVFISYLMVLFQVVVDIFRDRELNGWARVVWIVALFIALPLTALVYLIAADAAWAAASSRRNAASQSAAEDQDPTCCGPARPGIADRALQALDKVRDHRGRVRAAWLARRLTAGDAS
ncbi:MAG: hypothetical protein U0R79_10805 [Propionicimonas sp.]